MKILHTADIHLRRYKDERWLALENLIEIGKKESIDVFVISGDLFEREVDSENLRPRIREVFSGTGFKIILIPGNHDIDSYKSWTYFGEDVFILKDLQSPLELENVRIWGMPFEDIDEEKTFERLYSIKERIRKDKKNILLFHGELIDSFFSRKDFGEEGEKRYMPVKLSYFKEIDFDYVLAGHLHSRFDIWKMPNGGFFVYPGSPVSVTKKETGKRKVNLFEVGKEPKEYPVRSFHYEKIDIKVDPFEEGDPFEKVKERIEKTEPEAKILLKVEGYIDRKMYDEKSFIEKILRYRERYAELPKIQIRDIHDIVEDDLFKSLLKKIQGFDEERKKRLIDLAIRAMIEAGI